MIFVWLEKEIHFAASQMPLLWPTRQPSAKTVRFSIPANTPTKSVKNDNDKNKQSNNEKFLNGETLKNSCGDYKFNSEDKLRSTTVDSKAVSQNRCLRVCNR